MNRPLQIEQLYYDIITNPLGVEESDLVRLMDFYPYSQPLRYAWIRRKTLLHETVDKEKALLFAVDAGWLWQYAHHPLEIVEELVPVPEEYIPFEDVAEEHVLDSGLDQPTADTDDSGDEVAEDDKSLDSEEEALNRLVREGSVVGNYFVFEQKEKGEEVVEENVSDDEEPEDVSLYNDELMPYSFRWWLHKTRLQHADTYQPFITVVLPKPQKGQFDPRKLDETILDQQIKESIIHFQDPEMKLSEEVKSRPVVEEPPRKKGDDVIEKFIREDPMIQAPAPNQLNTENKARQSSEDNYDLVTETLANIYANQGFYLKSVEVFKKLILKYPEKKSYFATRIQELEKNI